MSLKGRRTERVGVCLEEINVNRIHKHPIIFPVYIFGFRIFLYYTQRCFQWWRALQSLYMC